MGGLCSDGETVPGSPGVFEARIGKLSHSYILNRHHELECVLEHLEMVRLLAWHTSVLPMSV